MKPERMLALARQLDENPYLRITERVREALDLWNTDMLRDHCEDRDLDIEYDPESGVPVRFVRGLCAAHAFWAGGRGPETPLEAAHVVWALIGAPNRLSTLSKGRRLARQMKTDDKLRAEVAEYTMAHFIISHVQDDWDVKISADELNLIWGSFPRLGDFVAQFHPDDDPERWNL